MIFDGSFTDLYQLNISFIGNFNFNTINTQQKSVRIGLNNWYGNMVFPNGSVKVQMSDCNKYNGNIIIPSSVKNCVAFLYGCQEFNTPIEIPYGVTNCTMMFEGCKNFNQPVNIPDNVTNCYEMFRQCDELDSDIKIGNSVTEADYMFYNCRKLGANNSNVTLGSSLKNCSNMFYAAGIKHISGLPSTLKNCDQMFKYASNFNFDEPAIISNSVTSCVEMFQFCSNLNQEITIGTHATNCVNMFYGANKLNSGITLLAENCNCTRMFKNCTNYNQPFNIPYNTKAVSMFEDCNDLDGLITIGEITNCQSMLRNDNKFNQPTTIPESCTSLYGMFGGCDEQRLPILLSQNTLENNYQNNALKLGWSYNATQSIVLY